MSVLWGCEGVVLISVRSHSPTRAWTGERADQGRAGIIVGGKRRWDMGEGVDLYGQWCLLWWMISAWLAMLVVRRRYFVPGVASIHYKDLSSLNRTVHSAEIASTHRPPNTPNK